MKKIVVGISMLSFLLVGCSDSSNEEIIKEISNEVNNEVDNSDAVGVVENVSDTKITDKLKDKSILENLKGSSTNEYGETWETYYEGDYENFTLKTKGDSFYITGEGRELFGITIGTGMSDVRSQLGEPLQHVQKLNNLYEIASTENYMYEIEGNYVTFFFDKHNSNKLRSILVIPVETENIKDGFYAENSNDLRLGFEDLMVDLINESRISNGLYPLKYDKKLNEVARLHSRDMIINKFFDHTGSDGSNAKERAERLGYAERMYGENIAFGQYSSIHAHEELMNSIGHRENILNDEFTHVGVGVEIDEKNVPYFTINFYTSK